MPLEDVRLQRLVDDARRAMTHYGCPGLEELGFDGVDFTQAQAQEASYEETCEVNALCDIITDLIARVIEVRDQIEHRLRAEANNEFPKS